MNITNQSLLLFRRLARLATTERVGRIKYRAYRRWLKRQQTTPGTILPCTQTARYGLKDVATAN